MKKRLILILLTAVFMMVSGCGNKVDKNNSDTYQELSEGDTAPDFTAETVEGKTFALSEQKDKVVLLNFWATWCGPCVGEMPAFEKLYSEYGDKIAILAVDCAEDENTVKQFVSDNGYTFPIAYDTEGSISAKYPTSGIPYTLVIGKDGIIKNIYLGANDADAQYVEYKEAIEAVLGEQPFMFVQKEDYMKKIIRRGLLITAIVFIFIGLNQNGFNDMKNKAIRICYECIGIG